MKAVLRGCSVVLLVIVVAVVCGAWYWGLIALGLYQIASTIYCVHWTEFVDTLWYYIWACYRETRG